MRFSRTLPPTPRSLGILAGSFNPPTIAHLELVRASRSLVDALLCVVPCELPHKEYFGATLEQRLDLLGESLPPDCGLATSERGLLIDIARECREQFGGRTRLYFVCGRDAAERILNWDYGRTGVVEQMLEDFQLLVARRSGYFEAPLQHRERIHQLDIQGFHDDVSSTTVRERIAKREPWEHLVPESIVDRVRSIYS